MGVDWEAEHRAAASDPRMARQLIALALNAEDEHAAWAAIDVLRHRGDRVTFEAARDLCASADLEERTWGVRILAQLGIPKRSFPDQSLDILLPLLALEKDVDLLSDIAFALGHIGDARAVKPLSRLRNHPSPEVRYGVVHGLLCQENERAIQALIELSADEDTDVRDWATFGLGTQIDTDTPEIRDALFARLADEDGATRGEALVGLARRNDERVIEPLIRELSSANAGNLAVEAARELGDPCLRPALLRLRERWGVEGSPPTIGYRDRRLLDEAISRCMGENS
jgi:HEAT repeat protein